MSFYYIFILYQIFFHISNQDLVLMGSKPGIRKQPEAGKLFLQEIER